MFCNSIRVVLDPLLLSLVAGQFIYHSNPLDGCSSKKLQTVCANSFAAWDERENGLLTERAILKSGCGVTGTSILHFYIL
jgi:hypothetical protein